MLAILFTRVPPLPPNKVSISGQHKSFPLLGAKTVISEAPKPSRQPSACKAAVRTHAFYQLSLALSYLIREEGVQESLDCVCVFLRVCDISNTSEMSRKIREYFPGLSFSSSLMNLSVHHTN